MGQDTFGFPSSFSRPAVFARRSTKEGIMKDYGLSYWRQRNVPSAWPRIRAWAPGANVGTLLSVVQTGVGASGPTRSMLPQAQPPLTEQPQRTREEPYHSQFPILSVLRARFRGA